MANQAPEPAPADEAAQPDHLTLAALKAKCTAAWIAHPVKIGTAPFKAGAWEYFYPCEDPPDSPGGTPPDPYDGKVKSIFLSDDQKPLSRKGGVVTITGYLIGRPGAIANFRAQVHPGAAGFRADLRAEYDRLVAALNAGRAESKELKRKRKEQKRSLNAGAAASSDGAFKQMGDSPSSTADRSKVRRTKSVGAMDTFVRRQHATVVGQHSDKLAHDQARLFIGCNISDATADSPLLHQFVQTVLEAGAAGATLPPTDAPAIHAADHIRLLTNQQLGGDVLTGHAKLYHEKVSRKQHDINCATKMWGFSATSDGTDRMGKGVINLVLLYKDGTTTFLKLHDASGHTKNAQYITDLMVGWFSDQSFPIDCMDLVFIVMDGGERSSFSLIESTFGANPALPNVMCLWCAAHAWNLLLKAFGELDGVDGLIIDLKFVINFVRNHGTPRSLLRKLHKLSMLVWAATRFGTIFICMERVVELEEALRKLVMHADWNEFLAKQSGEAKAKAIQFRGLVEDRSFYAKMKKTLELTERVYAIMRICDSDIHNTIGAIYEFFLKAMAHAEEWEKVKFDQVDGVDAFTAGECTLIGNQSTEDTGAKVDAGFTALAMVSFRWAKIAGATNTNTAHVLGRWLNPACIGEDFTCDGQIELARKGLEHFFPGDIAKVTRIWNQHKLYMALDQNGALFYNEDGTKKRTCDLNGPDHGCSGADWWFAIDYPHDAAFVDLRAFAMRILAQKAQESAAERHFSLTDNIQTKNKGSMQPKSLEKRCIFRSELLQEIAECAGQAQASNHGLQTVDEAPPPPPPPPVPQAP